MGDEAPSCLLYPGVSVYIYFSVYHPCIYGPNFSPLHISVESFRTWINISNHERDTIKL